jgi:type IV secretory pathway VirB4 component
MPGQTNNQTNVQTAAATVSGAPADAQNAPADKPKNPNSTQNSLQLSELRDNMVIMNDGSFRAVVACESINFDLMSERERDGVEYSYQNFLNSLYFPIQIFIRSQRVDIGPYLDKLAKLRQSQDNMLLGVLMDDYINFIDALSGEANIMDKSFFVVVPYYLDGSDVDAKSGGAKSLLTGLLKPTKPTHIKVPADHYEKAKDEIKNRVDSIVDGLSQVGVRAVQLKTKELATLYYNVYNPDQAVREPLGDFHAYENLIVQKGEGQAPQPNLDGGQNV